MNKDLIIYNIIKQLTKVSIDKMIRKEDVRLLTPIVQVSEGPTAKYEPEGTFLVGKKTPKGEKLIFEDLMTSIASKELYPLYMKLPKEEFISRFNKMIHNYIVNQFNYAEENNVPDKDNLWFKPNMEFINWFQKQGLDISKIESLIDNTLSGKQDLNATLYVIADDMRDRCGQGKEFASYRDGYKWAEENYTYDGGKEIKANRLESAYHKAKSEGKL